MSDEPECPILKPPFGTKWAKAKCLRCPATAFIRVPEAEKDTVYMCPTCAVTSKLKKDLD